MTRKTDVEKADSRSGYRKFRQGDLRARYHLRKPREQPERAAAPDREFLGFATGANVGPLEGPADSRYEYLLVVAPPRA